MVHKVTTRISSSKRINLFLSIGSVNNATLFITIILKFIIKYVKTKPINMKDLIKETKIMFICLSKEFK